MPAKRHSRSVRAHWVGLLAAPPRPPLPSPPSLSGLPPRLGVVRTWAGSRFGPAPTLRAGGAERHTASAVQGTGAHVCRHVPAPYARTHHGGTARIGLAQNASVARGLAAPVRGLSRRRQRTPPKTVALVARWPPEENTAAARGSGPAFHAAACATRGWCATYAPQPPSLPPPASVLACSSPPRQPPPRPRPGRHAVGPAPLRERRVHGGGLRPPSAGWPASPI